MRFNFITTDRHDGISVLEATLPRNGAGRNLIYRTRTGALLRVNGAVAGAFDAEHTSVNLPSVPPGASLRLEVEEESLPSSGLPSGPGLAWWWMNFRSHPVAARVGKLVSGISMVAPAGAAQQPLIGHSHLDVAWLWTYEQTRRKALRTFATALRQLERYPGFVFSQSQPQLYEFVEQEDATFFERLRGFAVGRRFDCTIASLWVESDCNIPCGEALLRQMMFAHQFIETNFGQQPSVAWLPDSFGFANTLPTLLNHAGIQYFATTKLQWNDTTRFPYHQFVWRGPDGSQVLAAQIASYEGDATPRRLATAQKRKEPLIVGYGDGGGGVADATIERASSIGRWTCPTEWFAQLEARGANLPVHDNELYLEYHRGVFTTHHRIKARSARLERELLDAEERAAWCVALGVPRESQATFRLRLSQAWKIVLRNHFHDVITGTSIGTVYDDVQREYDEAQSLVDGVAKSAQSMLPRAAARAGSGEPTPVTYCNGRFRFGNGLIDADVGPDGQITRLCASGGPNVVERANILAAYVDQPKAWDAWNLEAGYQAKSVPIAIGQARCSERALEIPLSVGKSQFIMRVTLGAGEHFLRVELDGLWNESHRLLRVENRLRLNANAATFGTPHGTVTRSAQKNTPERRAQFEVPGQRYAFVAQANGTAVAVLTLDTYGWNARDLPRGRMHLGHSLLRAPVWPDAMADRGEQHLAYAFAVLPNIRVGVLEQIWHRYAHGPTVRLFLPEDDGVLVVACKPAQNGEGVVLRVRECDGRQRSAKIFCAARAREVAAVDALERPTHGAVSLQGESIAAELGPYALHSFRVRFQ
ncbi:MAG: hypothetical protein M3Z14_04535 [Candidatus Eremiobacteraeota bacterium]|nr:hypothetical protein [Candidatus Eremiobacteraeota bacterium]